MVEHAALAEGPRRVDASCCRQKQKAPTCAAGSSTLVHIPHIMVPYLADRNTSSDARLHLAEEGIAADRENAIYWGPQKVEEMASEYEGQSCRCEADL